MNVKSSFGPVRVLPRPQSKSQSSSGQSELGAIDVSDTVEFPTMGLVLGAATGAVVSWLSASSPATGLGVGALLGFAGGTAVGLYNAWPEENPEPKQLNTTPQYEWDDWTEYKGRRPQSGRATYRAGKSQSSSTDSGDDNGIYLRSNLDWGFKSGQMEWSFSEGPRNTTLWPRRDGSIRII